MNGQMPPMKEVNPEDFRAFLDAYSSAPEKRGKLRFNASLMFEPPRLEYHDFSDGKVWPASIVAYRVGGDGACYVKDDSYDG